MSDRLLAFIDEAGQRSASAKSSAHFVMSAVAWEDGLDSVARQTLESIRLNVGRRPTDEIHFVKLNHHARLAAARQIGNAGKGGVLTVISICVCKRELQPLAGFTEDHAYLWTYRLLLERLSWLARARHLKLDMTMAHVRRFKKATLRSYEHVLRDVIQTEIKWDYVPAGASLSTPKVEERLQLADVAASTTFQAFEEQNGFTETRYLEQMAPGLWRRNGNLLSYGLKVHPRPRAPQYAWCNGI